MADNKFPIKMKWQEGGYRVVVDEALDANSSNPVANWVLKEAIAQGGGGGGGGGGTWGSIIGDIVDQTDLITYISNALDGYYTKTVTYTKTEVDNLLDKKANSSDVYTSKDVDDLLDDKADASSVYTKLEVNGLVDKKANITDVYEKTETYNKTEIDDFIKDKADSDKVYTKTEVDDFLKTKANADEVYSINDTDALLNNKADKSTTYTKTEVDALIPVVNDGKLTIQKNGTDVDTFTANQSSDKTINITVPTTAADVNALPDTTKYASGISVTVDPKTYIMTTQLKDQDGNNIGTEQKVDLPLDSVVVSGRFDKATKKIILVLNTGDEIEFSVADLVEGLQTEITSTNKLDADLVDDTTSVNKFFSSSDKSKLDGIEAGANKYELPTMSTTVKGGAKVGAHLEMDGEELTTALDVALIEVDSTGIAPAIKTENIKDGAVTAAKLDKSSIIDIIYPVGSLYMSVNNVSPQVFLGGVWTPYAQGRFIAGIGSTTDAAGNAINMSAGETGGQKTHSHTLPDNTGSHTLTANEMPKHTHKYGSARGNTSVDGTSSGGYKWHAINNSQTSTEAGGGAGHTHPLGGSTGSTNVWNPFCTAYIWKRTA